MVLWAPHARSNKFFTSLRPGHGSRPCCNSHPKAVTLLSRCCQQAMVVADQGLRCDVLWLARPQAGRRSDKGTQKQHVCAWEPPVCICNDSLQPAETVYGCRPGKPSDRSHHCLQHSCKSPNQDDAPLRATLTSDGKNDGSPLTYMLLWLPAYVALKLNQAQCAHSVHFRRFHCLCRLVPALPACSEDFMSRQTTRQQKPTWNFSPSPLPEVHR